MQCKLCDTVHAKYTCTFSIRKLIRESNVRCQRDNKRCIVEEPTPRPVRGKGTSKARVAEMEKKLDGLVALLTGAKSISSSKANANEISATNLSDQEQAAIGLANLAPSLARIYGQDGDGAAVTRIVNETQLPDFNVGTCLSALRAKDKQCESSQQSRQEEERDKQRQEERARQDCNNGFNFIMPPPVAKFPLEDVIGRNLVTEAEAEQYLANFREMATHFPFYIFPPGATAASLRKSKPVLLLAMLTTGSGREKRVQTVLERDFRKVFSERIIMNGEKNLELLQSGLIYLGWFQCHFSPKTQIFLQMIYIFISLVTELGYDRKPDRDKSAPAGGAGLDGNTTSPRFSENGDSVVSPGKLEERELRSKEIRRAFLGCWWLTNAISIDFRKRIPMHYSDYMRKCQQSFVDNPEFESDKYMVVLLRLQKFQEDVCETYRYHDPEIAGKQDLLRIQLSLKAFQSQLRDLEREISYLDPRHPAFDAIYPSYFAMGMYLHEIGLHMTPPPPSTSPFAPSFAQEYTTERINILSECLSYCKKFLDCMTTRSPQTFRNITALAWMRISYGLVVLSKLALGGTEPVDLCNIKEKTVIQYSNRQYTTLNPHPSMVEQAIREEKERGERRENRSQSPEIPRPGIALIPSPTNVDGWDTSVVRSAVRMEVFLDRMVEICKVLHEPTLPIKEEDRERYRLNGVEETTPPDVYDFGMWMFGTMKEWYVAMVRREEEIEDAVKDAISATPGSATVGSLSAGSGSNGGSIASGAMGSSRTRSTSVSIVTPAGSTLEREWGSPNSSFQTLKRKFDSDKMNGRPGVNPAMVGGNGDYGSPGGGGGMQGMNPPNAPAGGSEMALPPSIGFDWMDTGDNDFWGTMWSSWPLFYPGG
ncbi:hypothetical protein H072_10149 [Dactylellina haptotyla CBS 200.50]|uniref:Transcription factor domain-containing protein n=1 Tax=Dactylellina haptotyla (strain CBS 200.50) TaxID=1284197 RepID=S8A0Y5_DACHA|nr:hypothetical protein H072_10149 [Dactylellina haptotyla CBS 200.50]